jgi:hypothetical protein
MLAHKWFTIELGADSALAKTALQTVHRPESHREWGSRYRMAVKRPVAPL